MIDYVAFCSIRFFKFSDNKIAEKLDNILKPAKYYDGSVFIKDENTKYYCIFLKFCKYTPKNQSSVAVKSAYRANKLAADKALEELKVLFPKAIKGRVFIDLNESKTILRIFHNK